jgi:hypothetical protein
VVLVVEKERKKEAKSTLPRNQLLKWIAKPALVFDSIHRPQRWARLPSIAP